jgi:L-amino acid N-acyltransferase YncA
VYKCEACDKDVSVANASRHRKSCKHLYTLQKTREENTNLKIENSRLKMESEINARELAIYKDLASKTQTCMEEIAKQPRVSNNTTKNKITLTPLDLSEGRLKAIVDTNFTRNHLLEAQKGVARFTFDHVLKDEQGKLTYVCTDSSRHSYKYITEDGIEVKDVKGKKLTSAIYPSVIDRSRALVNEGINDQPTNFPLYTDSFIDIKDMGNDNSDFRAELAGMTS